MSKGVNGLPARKPGAKPRERARVLVWGDSSQGKSYGACGFTNAFYIDSENGAAEEQFQKQLAAGGSLYMGHDEGSRDPAAILEAVQELGKAKHNLRWIIFDSLSKLFGDQIASDYDRMVRGGRDMDKTFGAEKKGAVNFVRRLIHWADLLNMNTLFICHRKSLWRDGKEIGETFDAWDKLEYELHLTIRVLNRNALVTKSRYDSFPLRSSFPWAYDEFASRFGRQAIEAPAAPVALATPAQVAELERLIKELAIPAEVSDKWLTKAGAENWAEAPSETVGKCIEWCIAKVMGTTATKKE